jgi:hypothetical protein
MMSDRFLNLGGYRLTPDRELLLQATLLEGDAALTAWEQWQSSIDIEVLEPGSYELLPQLYQNLLAHGVEDPQMARLKGIYRRNWYANQLQLKRLNIVLSHLKSVGIEAIVLGAAALCHEHYRSISSLQLSIRATEMEAAVRHLTALNWHLVSAAAYTPVHLQDDRNQSLYLQGHLFWATPQEYTDEQVWQYGIPSGDNPLGWQLSPTDRFLTECASTFFHRRSPQIYGIADAFLLMQKSGENLDWMRSIAQAQRYQMILPVRNMLAILERVLHISAPNWVLPALYQMPIARSEWLNYQVLAEDRRSLRRSILAQSLDRFSRLETRLLQVRNHPFPGRQVLKGLLKPTR